MGLKKEDEILITKEKKQWFILSEIVLEKDNLLEDFANIEEMIKELETKKTALKRKQKDLEHKQNEVHSVIDEIYKRRTDSASKQNEFKQRMEEMKEEKKQNVLNILIYNHHQIRNEIQMKSKIKDELKAFMSTKNEHMDALTLTTQNPSNKHKTMEETKTQMPPTIDINDIVEVDDNNVDYSDDLIGELDYTDDRFRSDYVKPFGEYMILQDDSTTESVFIQQTDDTMSDVSQYGELSMNVNSITEIHQDLHINADTSLSIPSVSVYDAYSSQNNECQLLRENIISGGIIEDVILFLPELEEISTNTNEYIETEIVIDQEDEKNTVRDAKIKDENIDKQDVEIQEDTSHITNWFGNSEYDISMNYNSTIQHTNYIDYSNKYDTNDDDWKADHDLNVYDSALPPINENDILPEQPRYEISMNYDHEDTQHKNYISHEIIGNDDKANGVTNNEESIHTNIEESTTNLPTKYNQENDGDIPTHMKSSHALIDNNTLQLRINMQLIENIFQDVMYLMSYAFPDNEPALDLNNILSVNTDNANPLAILRTELDLHHEKYVQNVEKMICEQKSDECYKSLLMVEKEFIVEFINRIRRYLKNADENQLRYEQLQYSQFSVAVEALLERLNEEYLQHKQKRTTQSLGKYMDDKPCHQNLEENAIYQLLEYLRKENDIEKKLDNRINDIYMELIQHYTKVIQKYTGDDQDRQTLYDPLIRMNDETMEKYRVRAADLLKQIQYSKKKHCVQRITEEIANGRIDENIKELIEEDSFRINESDLVKFCNLNTAKRYKKIKIDIQEFGFRVYLYPNGSNKSNKGYVQFGITLKTIPSNVKSVVIYCNLFEKTTNTQHHCTLIFEDSTSTTMTWMPKLLSLQRCKKQKELEFGYIIHILQVRTKDGIVTDHAKNEMFRSTETMPNWRWKMDNDFIEQNAKNSILYNEFPWKNSMYVSLGVDAHKKQLNNILISFHIFKLPPKVEKLDVTFEMNTNLKELQIKKKKQCFFDYESTQCNIEINRKQSEKLLKMAHLYGRLGDFVLDFQWTINKVYFRGYADYPQNVVHTRPKLEKNVLKETPPKKMKSGKHNKAAKRGNGNHKQRKRNNKKQRH